MPAGAASQNASAGNEPKALVQNVSKTQLMELDPGNIGISPELSALRRNRTSKRYKEALIELATSIFENGQSQPGQVRETEEGLELIAGQRRYEAIQFLRSAEGQETLGLDEDQIKIANETMFRAELVEDVSPARAKHLALIENIQRENFTPMEIAHIIKDLRTNGTPEEKDKSTVGIANHLGVEKTQVTQHERLLTLPKEIQDKCDTGAISMATALEFANVKEGQEKKVAGRAEEIAAERAKKNADAIAVNEARIAKVKEEREAKSAEAVKKKKEVILAKVKDKKITKEQGDKLIAALTAPKEVNATPKVPVAKPGQVNKPKAPAAPAKAKVEQKDVRQAAKEMEAAKAIRAPRMVELKQLAETWTGPAFPGLVVAFAVGLMEWAEGKRSDKQMTALLEDVADELPASASGKKASGKKETKTPTAGTKKVSPVKHAAPAKKAVVPAAKKKTASGSSKK